MLLWGGAVAAGLLGTWSLIPGQTSDAAPIQEPPLSQPSPSAPPAPAVDDGPPAPPAVSAEGLVLYGVSGGGPAGMAALIGPASGYPRIVSVGKDYRPGLRIKEIGPTHAVLASGGQETALHLGGRTAAPVSRSAETTAVTAQPVAAPQPRLQGMDAVALRLGMRPRKEDGRITGFELKQSRDLAPLQRAGLQAGDVIVAINGQAFTSEEKLMELPQEIAGSYSAEFEIERDGRRMKLSLPVNKQP